MGVFWQLLLLCLKDTTNSPVYKKHAEKLIHSEVFNNTQPCTWPFPIRVCRESRPWALTACPVAVFNRGALTSLTCARQINGQNELLTCFGAVLCPTNLQHSSAFWQWLVPRWGSNRLVSESWESSVLSTTVMSTSFSCESASFVVYFALVRAYSVDPSSLVHA